MSEEDYSQDYIQDLTDRVFLVNKKINEGKINVPTHLIGEFRRSLSKIKLDNNGFVIPETVDGIIRSSALAIKMVEERESIKKRYSISDIQEAYFNHLDAYFGELYAMMTQAGAEPYAASEVFSKQPEFVSSISKALPDIFSFFKEFWSNCGDVGTYHLQDNEQLKSSFSGDIFPNYHENPISIAGLYIDTVILPCPVLKIARMYGIHPEIDVIKLLIKHVLTAMTYRVYAVADIEPHLVLIQPSSADINHDQRVILLNESKPTILKHANYLFARSFESLDDLKEFCGHIETVDQAMRALRRPDRLLIDAQWDKDPRVQLESAVSQGDKTIFGQKNTAGNQILATCVGRFSQAFGTRDNAIEYRGTPYIQAEASWQYYNWMMEYGSVGYDVEADIKGLHVMRALTSEMDNDLAWLGKVPPDIVLKLRANGQADEIRALLGTGISELIRNEPLNYYASAEKVVGNLEVAFRKHKKQILKARKEKLRLYGLDIPSCITVGTIAVAAAVTANPLLGVVAAGATMLGAPNIFGINAKLKQQQASENLYKSSPTALLFSHIK